MTATCEKNYSTVIGLPLTCNRELGHDGDCGPSKILNDIKFPSSSFSYATPITREVEQRYQSDMLFHAKVDLVVHGVSGEKRLFLDPSQEFLSMLMVGTAIHLMERELES